MTLEDIKTIRVIEVRNDPIKQRELKKLYFNTFGEVLTITCGNCIEDAIFRIRYYLNKKNPKQMNATENLFKLFDNQVLWVNAWAMHITNANLTNEIAIKLLKLNAANIKKFEKFPENWKELVSGVTKITIPEVKVELPVKDFEIIEEEQEVVENKKTFTAEELIASWSKKEIIGLLKENGIEVDENTAAKKIELAEKLALTLNKQ